MDCVLPAGTTDTVALADTVPDDPVASAVYVVVEVGLTTCVPPFAGRVYVLPSVPEIVTWEAFVAVTVKVDEPPYVMEAWLAVILTVVPPATVRLIVVYAAPPQ